MPTDDQLEIVRVLLGVALVLSNVAIWYGVYLERDKFPQATKDRGWAILVRALAAEAAFAFVLLAVDTTMGVQQRAEIERERLERTKLEAKLSPRRLSSEQAGKMSAALSNRNSRGFEAMFMHHFV